MDYLFNDWMELFDNKNFESLIGVPKELKKVAMLFATIKKEFKRVEISLGQRIESLQSTYESKSTSNIKSDCKKVEDISIKSSPPKENLSTKAKSTQNTKTLLKSPTFSRHRKRLNLKKINQSNLSSGFSTLKTLNSIVSSKIPDGDDKTLSVTIEDNDILDSSIIGTTPNISIKKTRSKWLSSRMKNKSVDTSKKSTLTQMFSEMVTKRENSEDESSMMDIEEIIHKVDTENSEKSSHSNISKDTNVTSFFNDYDKVPVLLSSPKKKFVFKETVRGNEKKKLKGWSCKECENFYKGMNLSEKELEKKMDECSKHRSRFKPDEETMPGYWNLSIPPTPEDQKTQITYNKEESIGNNSTIFQLY